MSIQKVKDITIVSLSRGTIGEAFVKHEIEIGLKRLKDYGLNVHFSKHALAGIDFLASHPELRAQDLIDAFNSDTDMILCAIGGDDTYKLLPYLFDHNELKNALKQKIFLGYSDTTMNHFMLHKVGLNTFYSQAFLSDICELDKDMLPYSKKYFEELLNTGTIAKIEPSDIWYNSREDFSVEAIGTCTASHINQGFELLQGSPIFEGEIFGGCIGTIYDMFDNTRYSDSVDLCNKYNLFGDLDDWKGKIMLLESSEERPNPELYTKMVQAIKSTGVFNVLNGLLIGKPYNEDYFEEYKQILLSEIDNKNLPIVTNINIGHALPRCIIPFGIKAKVDVNKQIITFNNHE